MSPMVKLPLAMEHALLGLVRQRSMHAYEIHQLLTQAEALGLVWQIKQGQTYALLARLEEAGYVASTLEAQDARPPRKILRLTPSGEAAFARWLATPVRHGRDFRLEFLAKLFFAAQEPDSTLSALLAAQRAACREIIAQLNGRIAAVSPDRPYDRLVLQFRLGQLDATLLWLDECAATLLNPSPAHQIAPENLADDETPPRPVATVADSVDRRSGATSQ
ncbi:MAG: PadR family transcriptional regulator [Thermomicrobiales bacterium]